MTFSVHTALDTGLQSESLTKNLQMPKNAVHGLLLQTAVLQVSCTDASLSHPMVDRPCSPESLACLW